MTKLTSSTTITGMETAPPGLILIIHSSQCMFQQVIPSRLTYHRPSRVEYNEATEYLLPGLSSNSKRPTTTKPTETSVSSKATTAQRQFDPPMARTEQVDLQLRFMPLVLRIRPELMGSMSLLVRWVIGWEVRTKLPLRLNRVSRAKCMSLEVLVFLISLLRIIVLP